MVIDPDVEEVEGASRVINGHANHGLLEEAGIQQAAGIVAGTDNDHDNLSILMCVRSLRPNAFTIVRQNSHENQIAFDAAQADLILQSSLTTARRILKHLISPQIQILIDYLREQGETTTQQVVNRLNAAIGDRPPHLWRVNLCNAEAIATVDYLKKHGPLSLRDLLRDPYDLQDNISCIPLVIERGDRIVEGYFVRCAAPLRDALDLGARHRPSLHHGRRCHRVTETGGGGEVVVEVRVHVRDCPFV